MSENSPRVDNASIRNSFSSRNIEQISVEAKAASLKAAQSGETVRHSYLVSEAIPQTSDGNYEWYQNELLMSHETIRREFLRAEHALNNLDAQKHPWQITCFYVWFSEFFSRVIDIQYEAEDEILAPHYKLLGKHFTIDFHLIHSLNISKSTVSCIGENVEFERSHTHEELFKMMYSIEKQAQFLFEAVHTAADASASPEIRNSFRAVDISQMQQSLKDSFKTFKEATFKRLNDEVV